MKTNLKGLFIEQFMAWRPSEVAWLVFCVASIVALSLSWGDTALGITAAVTGMMYTILAGKGKILCFVFGLVNTPLYAYISYANGYYGDFTLNVYYFVMMFPGLVFWGRNQAKTAEEGIVRTRLSAKARLKMIAGCVAAIVALWLILRLAGGNRPLCDAVTNVLSIAAMLLTVRRAIEEWIMWIIVDAVEVFMWAKAWFADGGTISILLMWLLFLANGIYLLSLWLRIESRRKANELP